MKKILLFSLFSLIATSIFAQTTISGRVLDAVTEEGIPGANVIIDGTSSGTVTDLEGNFSFETKITGSQTITISFIGYERISQDVLLDGTPIDFKTIGLGTSEIALEGVEVIAAYVESSRETPIAVSTIKTAELEERISNQEFPEILKSTPGIYATKQGGGFGDSRINVRGFDNTNVAVLINGIPVNDMENGRIFWSNWAGLTDATKAIQVQRGLGASKLAINSIGGTINIITKATDAEQGGRVQTTIGNNNYRKTSFAISTGLLEGDWAVTLTGSRVSGDGYIPGTYFEGWSYFASIAKNIGDNHQLVFTAVGAPQKHGQRFQGNRFFSMTDERYDSTPDGIRYNQNWGYRDGQVFQSRENFYHKPQLALNHYWDINETMSLNTSVYASWGRGGGSGPLGSDDDISDIDGDGNVTESVDGDVRFFTSDEDAIFRRANDQLLDWDKVIAFNRGDRSVVNSNGTTLQNNPVFVNGEQIQVSPMILRNSVNSHNWYGILSTFRVDLTDELNLMVGVDARTYEGLHYREVRDLLGGDAYYEVNDLNRQPGFFAREGDRIDYDNTGFVNWIGGFTQLEYRNDLFSAFVAGSISNTGYKRLHEFAHLDNDPARETDWQNYLGYNAKAGFGFNIDDNQNVYLNGGYYSRVPFFDDAFDVGNDDPNPAVIPDVENEKIAAVELGYGLSFSNLVVNLNAYYTQWIDRSFNTAVGNDIVFITGQNALHQGIELDVAYRPVSTLQLSGMISLGDWVWQNDVDATLRNEETNEEVQVQIFADGLKVGNAAQTTAYLGARWDVSPEFYLGLDYYFADDFYAQYDPADRDDETNRAQPWKLPSYHLFDLRAGYNFKISGFNASVMGNVQNLFDTQYIADAVDGANNDRASSPGILYGFGRTWTASFRVDF